MKYIVGLFVAIACCTSFIACDDDEWSDGDPAMEHVYYFAFENWGTTTATFNKNAVEYNVDRGATVAIPMQFHSERIRSYDVTVYYYVSSAAGDLTRGVDYQVVDENGATLTPGSRGEFSFVFPKAGKGVKNVYIKALNGAAGSFSVLAFDPAAGEIAYPDNIVNNETNDYAVWTFTTNYKVKVNVK